MLKLKNVSFSYGDKDILKGFSLEVSDGETVLLSGESGCGKTTVTRIILGLEKPTSGVVEAPENVSCVFQEDRLVPHLSVLHNVTLCAGKDKKETAEKLLFEAGLSGVIREKPAKLSGGMKRRVAIVRALAAMGDALILDEPFNGLDAETKETMIKMIRREAAGVPILLISHNAEDAELMDARVVNM